MQNQKKPINWLVILLGMLLIGLSIWSIRIVIHSTQPSTNESQERLERLSSGLGVEDGQNTKRILVVGGEDNNPPYSYLEEGQALGLDNDLMREIALNLGMQIEYNLTSLDEAKQNLRVGKIDVINGLVESDQANQDFLFGTPYAIMAYDLFVKRDSGIRSISDIGEGTIIVPQDDGMEQYLKDMGYSGQIITSKDSKQALSWVASNQYDAILMGKIQGYYLINSNHFINLEAVGENFSEGEYSFAVSAENRHLLLEMNQAFTILESSGVYNELTSKWLTTHQQSSFIDKNEYIIYGLVILLTSALIIILWAWSLRRQVKRKTAELRASEKKYRLLIKSATEGVAIVADKKIIYLNPQGALIFEITESASERKPYMLDFIHPLDQELVLIKYQQLLDGLLMDALLSFRIITVSGTVKWIRVNNVKIDWEGKPALLTFFSDTTEERTLTETIRSSEERYRLIFDQSPVGMFYYNSQLRITNVNDRFNEIMHKNRGELLDFDLNTVSDSRVIDVLKNVMNKESGYYEGWINPLLSDGQPDLFVKLRTTPLFSDKFEYQGGIAIVEDITNQVMSEHKIQNLEDNLSKFFFTSPDAISISTIREGILVDCNRGFTELTGYTREEVVGKTVDELKLWMNSEDRDQLIENLLIKGEYKNLEAQFRTKFNQIYHGLLSASIIEIDGQSCLLAITRNIDEIKKSDELIRNSEMRYKSIFESVPVSIWEQDLLEVFDMLEELRNTGITDLKEYLDNHPDFVDKAIKSVKNLDVNNVSLNLYKAKNKEQLNFSLDKIFNKDSIKNFKQELLAIWNHETYFNGDSVNVTLEGEEIPINLVMRIPETREEFQHILVSIMDITQRKRAEQALFESESRFRRLVEQVNVVVYLDFAEIPSRPKYVSPQIESLIGYTQEEWLADPELMMKIIHPDDLPGLEEVDIDTDKTGEPFVMEYRAFTKDGRMIWVHDEAVLAYDGNGNRDYWHGVMYDITARKMAEDALRESENRYRTIFNSVPVSIKEEDFSIVLQMIEEVRLSGVTDFDEYLSNHPEFVVKAVKSIKINEVNQESLRIYKANTKEQLLLSLDHYYSEESYLGFEKALTAIWNHQKGHEHETVNMTLTGEKIYVWVSITIPTVAEDFKRLLVTVMDMTERKQAEEQIRVQIKYLAALRAVDMAISASMDLPITLRVLLNQVHQQLLADAVCILILDPHTQTLRYSAGIGFQTNAIEYTNLRLGQSYAGQAALGRRIVTADDLATKTSLIMIKDLDKEEFTHYIGVPLISKGMVKGVLELYNHGPFAQDSAWMGLLESMAGQAAIAIENATLMDEVQKVNVNLRSAYDAALEGWARSIDIRNGDSETHAKHLADLTVELAQMLGYQGEGLLTLRRGALLHDIGELCVPDSIIFKEGPLTDSEWAIMRTHPAAAKRILTSIDFLQSSIEIPYYHHERWDGTGYPEGLSENDIPFAARVFSVVDCWESLRSDRPWRKAWTDENAWEYIESNSGKAFDPQIVEKLRQLLGHGFAAYF